MTSSAGEDNQEGRSTASQAPVNLRTASFAGFSRGVALEFLKWKHLHGDIL